MPKGYLTLTYNKRCKINALLKRGFSQKEIAKGIKVHQSTISREISRNKTGKKYEPDEAETKAKARCKASGRLRRKMVPELSGLVDQKLRESKWSPKQISGYFKNQKTSISHVTIYKYIGEDKNNGGDLYKNLRCQGKKYNKRSAQKTAGRGLTPNRVDIDLRPPIVDQKIRIDDLEQDTIVGAHHQGAVITLVDRVSKFTWLALVDRSTADNVAQKTVQLLAPVKDHVHTITSDNGKEFAGHQRIAKALGVDFYFAKPYSSWQRGLNENTNRLLRQFIPKKTNFASLNQAFIDNCAYLLNTRPRKSLNYQPF